MGRLVGMVLVEGEVNKENIFEGTFESQQEQWAR